MTTINLSAPIVVNRNGEDIETRTLELRPPVAREFVRYGNPFTWKSMDVDDARSRPVFNDRIVASFLADCCSVSPAAIESMTAPDYISARWDLLMSILGDDTSETAKDPGTITLASPIATHAGSVSTLKLATPKAKIVIQNGVPFDLRTDEYNNAYVVYNSPLCMKYLCDMTARDEVELADISASDWLKVCKSLFVVFNAVIGTAKDPLLVSAA